MNCLEMLDACKVLGPFWQRVILPRLSSSSSSSKRDRVQTHGFALISSPWQQLHMKDLSLTVGGMREMHQIRHIQSCSLPGYCSWFADSSYGRSQGMTQSCLVVLGPDFAAGNNVEVARAWEGQARGFSCPFVLGVQLTFIFHAAGSCFSVLQGDEDFREGWALLQVFGQLMLPCS